MKNRLYKFLDFLAISWALKRNVTMLSADEIAELELSRLKLKTIKSQIVETSLNPSGKMKQIRKILDLKETKSNEPKELYPY